MDRPSHAFPKLFAWVASFSATTFSVSELQAQALIGAGRGPSGYLSPLKLGLLLIVFLIWVKLSDWINRDTIRIGDLTGHPPKIWNPISLGAFLVGFLAALSIPIFWAGFPVYVLSAFAPFTVYLLLRRTAVNSDRSVAERLNPDAEELIEQELGAAIEFSPAGDTNADQQANLIRARQSPAFPVSKDLLSDVILKRAEVLLIDYSQTQATPRILVDGTWHAIAPMDRETGDGVLFSLKHLAGLNPGERRALQSGKFALKSPDHGKRKIELSSQGIPNGERVQIKIIGANADPLPLKKLGLLPSMEAPFSAALNSPGICIVSAPPKEGLTTTWQGMMLSADRLTRDCIGLVTVDNEKETAAIENIVIKHYEPGSQQTIADQAILTQPNSMAVPNIESKGVMDSLVKAAQSQDVSVWLQTPAKSSVEALLRTSLKANSRKQFAECVKHVTNQRLARRLCDACKQEIRVQPKLIQQLGGDPRKQGTIFQAYRLPPPEQRIDENGKPIEFPPCKTCGGLGHVGRIALFEMLTVNQAVCEALLSSNPDLKTIDAAATKTKAKIPMSASAWKLVLLGVISLQEAQATLKK